MSELKKMNNACYNKLLIQQQNARNKTLAKLFTKSRDSYHGNSVVMVTDPGLALIFCIKMFCGLCPTRCSVHVHVHVDFSYGAV